MIGSTRHSGLKHRPNKDRPDTLSVLTYSKLTIIHGDSLGYIDNVYWSNSSDSNVRRDW